MSLSWEPVWEDYVAEYAGVRIKTRRDKATGLIECPICGPTDKPVYLYTDKDLVMHLTAHAKGMIVKPSRRASEQEEQEEETLF